MDKYLKYMYTVVLPLILIVNKEVKGNLYMMYEFDISIRTLNSSTYPVLRCLLFRSFTTYKYFTFNSLKNLLLYRRKNLSF